MGMRPCPLSNCHPGGMIWMTITSSRPATPDSYVPSRRTVVYWTSVGGSNQRIWLGNLSFTASSC